MNTASEAWTSAAHGYIGSMRTSDHTAAEWTSLGITFLVLGVALAVTVSLIIGIALAVAGLLIIVQIKLRIGPAPKPDDAPRSG